MAATAYWCISTMAHQHKHASRLPLTGVWISCTNDVSEGVGRRRLESRHRHSKLYSVHVLTTMTFGVHGATYIMNNDFTIHLTVRN